MDENANKTHRTVFEEIEVSGGQLLEKIRELVRQGNIRTLRVRAGDGFALEMPMTLGALAGGVVVLTAPWLAVLGVIAAMITRVKIEVEREIVATDAPDPTTATPTDPTPSKEAADVAAAVKATAPDVDPTEVDRAIDA